MTHVPDISPEETWQALQADPKAVLVDVRTDAEWNFVGLADLSAANKQPLLIPWQVYPSMQVNGAFAEHLKQAGVTVWLAGMMAGRNLGPEYVAAFDGLYRKLADKYQVPFYPFLLDGVAQDPALNQADGIHPNPKGAEIIAGRLLPFVTKNLDDHAASVRRPARP